MDKNYTGPEEAWGTIWRAVGGLMVSSAFPADVREQVSQARAQIMTATAQVDDEPADNTVTVAGALDFHALVVGKDYKYNIKSGQFQWLDGAPCRIISKARTRVKTKLSQDWGSYKAGHQLTVYPSHLRNV